MKKAINYIYIHRYGFALISCCFLFLLLVKQKPIQYYGLWLLWMIQVFVLFCNLNMYGNKRKLILGDYDDKTNRPIKSRDLDEYNVANIIDLIETRIKQISNCKNSYILGINGAWGIGKTSIVNIVENELGKISNDYIFVHFNPWHWSGATPETLVRALKDAFAESNDGNADIIEYFDKILEIYEKETIYIKLIKLIGMLGKKRDTFANIKNKISDRVDKKKFIIIVDDLDRCSSDELSVIFNLLRDFISWRNVIVILCYDRTEIEKNNIEIEKLVDNEIKIHIERSEIRDTFIRKLTEIHPLTLLEHDELLKCATWVDTPRKLKSIIIDVQSLWEDLKDKLYYPHVVAITILNKEDRYLYTLLSNSFIEIFKEDHIKRQQLLSELVAMPGINVNNVIKYIKYYFFTNINNEKGKWIIENTHGAYSLMFATKHKNGIWNSNVTESYFIYRYPKNTFTDIELDNLENILNNNDDVNVLNSIHKIINKVQDNKTIDSFIDQINSSDSINNISKKRFILAICSYNLNIYDYEFYNKIANYVSRNIYLGDIDLGIECISKSNHILISLVLYDHLKSFNNIAVQEGGENKDNIINSIMQSNMVKLLLHSALPLSAYGVSYSHLRYVELLGSSENIAQYIEVLASKSHTDREIAEELSSMIVEMRKMERAKIYGDALVRIKDVKIHNKLYKQNNNK